MARTVFLDDIYRLASKALAAGALRVSTGLVQWDIAGNCQRPHRSAFLGRPSRSNTSKYVVVTPKTPIPLEVVLFTRCRRCDNCRRYRTRLWAARAEAEILASHRTWFGTLTLKPEQQFLALTRADVKATKRGVNFAALHSEERQLLINAAIASDITKYLKRVRHHSGPFRYCCVCETHKSGDLHYHMLVHETDPFSVTWRTLSANWQLGFSKWKLVALGDTAPARYVAKYLSKSTIARVRASIDYGTPPNGIGFSLNIQNP